MHSIRFKVIAITIAAVLTAVVCVFLASYKIIQGEIERNSVEMMDLIVQDSRKSLEKYTDGIKHSMEMASGLAVESLDSATLSRGGVLGTDVSEIGRTPEQVAQLDTYLVQYLDQVQSEFAAIARHTNGVTSYYYCISPAVSTSQHGFFFSRMGRSGFSEREPLDARGLDPSDHAHDAWYYTPIKRGSPMWVGPYPGRFMDNMFLCSYVTPIYKSGTLIGVLGMDIPLETFASLVSGIHVYDTGFACLLDKEGHVLYHPNLEQGTSIKLPIDSQTLGKEDSSGTSIRYNYDGTECKMSFTTLSTGMKFVIVVPSAEVYGASMLLRNLILPITIAITVLFVVLTLFAMRRLTNPLTRLTAASQRLADADYDVELNYRGRDEIGVLTAAFQRMRSQLQTYIADLNRRVHTDDLTGLPNQRYFFELANAERQRLLDEGEKPVMLYINLMGMKQFNRQFGFDEGDRLIRKVARILSRHFGEDRASRFGQDQFAAVTCEDHLEERLYQLFAECGAANAGNSLPVSVGIYQDSVDEVVASVACDRAKFACDKRRGFYYSGFCYFDEVMLKQADISRYVINHLDQAIDEKWIEVWYQPITRSVSGKVCDEEALSRWIDPQIGRLAPNDFIPALEDSGLIYKLDLYVVDQVLEKIKLQEEAGLTVVPHSVNLSRSDFEVLDIVEEIRSRVDAAGVSRDRITIEITESIIGSDFAFMKKQVERFQSLGFPVWMDDFGSGYSSLNFLQSIKFDLLKFDMSFMRKLDEGPDGKVILTELIQMATALGVDTLCEGVETESQVRFLRDIGCSKQQGYYYSPAIRFEKIVERYEMHTQIGYENPDEAEYYEAIGKLNLYDPTAILRDSEGPFDNIFNTLPMGIMEIAGVQVEFVRTNQSYRDFFKRYFGLDLAKWTRNSNNDPTEAEALFIEHVRACCDDGSRFVFDERIPGDCVVHYIIRRISANPVTGATAVAIAVLSIDEPIQGLSSSRDLGVGTGGE